VKSRNAGEGTQNPSALKAMELALEMDSQLGSGMHQDDGFYFKYMENYLCDLHCFFM
jgi:hypothetical protein